MTNIKALIYTKTVVNFFWVWTGDYNWAVSADRLSQNLYALNEYRVH